MGKIWLVICGNTELLRVRDEIFARDAGARFLRFDGVGPLAEMARAFAGEPIGVALCARAANEEDFLAAVQLVAQGGFAEDLLVLASCAGPTFISRCFRAGATEVIAAGDVASWDDSGQITRACMGKEASASPGGRAPADDDEDRFKGLEYHEDLPPWDLGLDSGPADGAAAAPKDRGAASAETAPPAESGRQGPVAQEPEPEPPAGSGPQPGGARGSAPQTGGAGASRAPLVAVISGRGGCGKTTLVAAMAACAARAGLRAAVLDLDLMFGNLYTVLGATGFKGLESVSAHAEDGAIVDADIEGSAMRIGPGLTLWGPCEEPERAELMTDSTEQLIEVLRGLSDVIFVDTSVQWGDTVAMAVAACDRCLVVGCAGASVVGSTKRAMDLAVRLGVPTTRMTGVFNRMGAHGSGEDQAMHFEIGISLRSRVRIPDGGEEVAGMLSFGQVDRLVAGSSAFARSVRTFTCEMLKELGCPINGWLLGEEQRRASESERARIRLPWKQKAGDVR